jgi:hypothetical protein
MANRPIPLRNVQSASRKTTAKPGRRPKKVAELVRPPEEMFPEILDLPFFKYVGRPPGEDQCDWWSVPIDDGLGAEMLGRHYALLTARFLHADSRDRSSVLLKIIGDMIERGHFWGGACGGKRDSIALGFVNGIADIMQCAYGNGLVNSVAMSISRHYDACAEDSRKRRGPKYIRKALTDASDAHRRFATESFQRDREAKP